MWNNLFKIRKNWNNPFSGGFVNDIEVTFDINAVYYCVECEIRMGSDGLNDEDVVYRKADLNDAENEDIWDDSALIRMYDEMINKTYDSLGEQYITTGRRKKKHRKGPRIKWYVGDRCMAPYYDDELWYPAVVREISLREGTCLVLYDVYDEQAWVDIADLMPIENDDEGTSNGNTTQETIAMKQQEWRINHTQTATDCFNHMQSSSTNQHTSIPSMVPPPPMAFNNLPAPDNDEALASMLMSWYMTGYHTGYYQALQDKKKKEVKNVSNNH
ncbi:Survival motor neuron protein [Dirofilaria immitis]